MAADIIIETDAFKTRMSDYRWVNIMADGRMVGKARLHAWATQATVYSITIFPEFQHRGYGRLAIERLRRDYDTMIADRVRHTARGFWSRMGFDARPDGNYVWKRRPRKQDGRIAA